MFLNSEVFLTLTGPTLQYVSSWVLVILRTVSGGHTWRAFARPLERSLPGSSLVSQSRETCKHRHLRGINVPTRRSRVQISASLAPPFAWGQRPCSPQTTKPPQPSSSASATHHKHTILAGNVRTRAIATHTIIPNIDSELFQSLRQYRSYLDRYRVLRSQTLASGCKQQVYVLSLGISTLPCMKHTVPSWDIMQLIYWVATHQSWWQWRWQQLYWDNRPQYPSTPSGSTCNTTMQSPRIFISETEVEKGPSSCPQLPAHCVLGLQTQVWSKVHLVHYCNDNCNGNGNGMLRLR